MIAWLASWLDGASTLQFIGVATVNGIVFVIIAWDLIATMLASTRRP